MSVELKDKKVQDLSKQFLAIRERTEKICKPLKVEDYSVQSALFASPAKWHLAHTTWFFEEMILKKFAAAYIEFDPEFGFLFNSYYNTVGDRVTRNDRGLITRPGVDEVYKYREYVNTHISKFLIGPVSKEAEELLVLGLNHEQQHQELLITDLKYTLSRNPIHPVYDKEKDLTADKNEEEGWLKVSEGIYDIGFSGTSFCFDNELSLHKVYLQEFEIAKKLVCNAEFMDFIRSDGYNNFRYWLDEGWAWIQENNIKAPLYWKQIKGNWYQFTLAGLKAVDPEAILSHISFYEASAFAAWKNCRLPTEFEWEAASVKLQWGKRWEWTNSAYLAYPGFNIAEGAVGEYNGKFMINQMVLRGASVATAPGHSRNTYRNFFHPNLQWQYSGIRLAK